MNTNVLPNFIPWQCAHMMVWYNS